MAAGSALRNSLGRVASGNPATAPSAQWTRSCWLRDRTIQIPCVTLVTPRVHPDPKRRRVILVPSSEQVSVAPTRCSRNVAPQTGARITSVVGGGTGVGGKGYPQAHNEPRAACELQCSRARRGTTPKRNMMRNKLLATVAMTALIGCTSFAVAQNAGPQGGAMQSQGAQQHQGTPGGAMGNPRRRDEHSVRRQRAKRTEPSKTEPKERAGQGLLAGGTQQILDQAQGPPGQRAQARRRNSAMNSSVARKTSAVPNSAALRTTTGPGPKAHPGAYGPGPGSQRRTRIAARRSRPGQQAAPAAVPAALRFSSRKTSAPRSRTSSSAIAMWRGSMVRASPWASARGTERRSRLGIAAGGRDHRSGIPWLRVCRGRRSALDHQSEHVGNRRHPAGVTDVRFK